MGQRVAGGELVELASGVDSFYLSGRGVLGGRLLEDLEQGRQSARETRSKSPLDVGNERWWIAGGALNRYPYRLEHTRGLIGLTTSASLPTVHMQPTAAFIHAAGIVAAIDWFMDAAELLLGRVSWKVSRVDLFMDSQRWGIESADRTNFVCRAKQRVVYEDDDTFRTLVFGTAKSGVKARIYDKTEESRKKGTDWWPAVWGEAYEPEQRVVRVEFQVSRQVLREGRIDTPADALDRLPELWGYLTDRWLSYREPSQDQTRSRWPVADEWKQIQAASLRGDAVGLSRVTNGATSGELRRIMPALRGYLARAGVLLGAETLDETLRRVGRHVALDELETGRPFTALLADKRLAVSA